MIHLPLKQGSPDWNMARAGIPTASEFDRILTPGGAPSKQAEAYLYRLVAERITGYPSESISTAAMQAGHEREPEAAAWYEFQSGIKPALCGLCLTDDGRVGASLDRFLGDDGVLELKCPQPAKQCEYLLDPAKLAAVYKSQVQGQLFVSGRRYAHLVSYCPGFQHCMVEIVRDEPYLAALGAALGAFSDQLDLAESRVTGGPRAVYHDFPGADQIQWRARLLAEETR